MIGFVLGTPVHKDEPKRVVDLRHDDEKLDDADLAHRLQRLIDVSRSYGPDGAVSVAALELLLNPCASNDTHPALMERL